MRNMTRGLRISIDTHENDGTPLNDHPSMDFRAIAMPDDELDLLCNDQVSREITLEELEAQDIADRLMVLA